MNKFLHSILLLLFLFFGQKINAQENESVDYLDSFPKPYNWANDMENIYSPTQLKTLDNLLNDFEKKSTIEIKLVTVDSAFFSRYKFDNIVSKIQDWNITKNAFDDTVNYNTYNCIFIMITKWGGRVQVFSESAFYGIGEILKNDESNFIVREAMYHLWRKEEYFKATLNGLDSLTKRIEEKLKIAAQKRQIDQ